MALNDTRRLRADRASPSALHGLALSAQRVDAALSECRALPVCVCVFFDSIVVLFCFVLFVLCFAWLLFFNYLFVRSECYLAVASCFIAWFGAVVCRGLILSSLNCDVCCLTRLFVLCRVLEVLGRLQRTPAVELRRVDIEYRLPLQAHIGWT